MKIRLTIIAAATLAFLSGGCSYLHEKDYTLDIANRKTPVEIIAHRGYSRAAPENTLAAIKAVGNLAGWTEMDVRLTSDGKLVLMHDEDIDRTTNGSGMIASHTYDSLRRLDAGSCFRKSFSSERIPTLAEAITTAKATGPRALVERKAGTAADYHRLFVAQKLKPDDFGVIAFDWNFLKDLSELNPDYHLGALGKGTLDQAVIDKAKKSGADFISWKHSNINQSVVNRVHASGMQLYVYTVNDPATMKKFIAMGVDGITTDEPKVLSELFPPPSVPKDCAPENPVSQPE